MNTEEDTNIRNRVSRRISENVTRENVSALARAVRKAFGRLIVCGRKDGIASLASDAEFNNNPIYTGQKIEVPWTREEFKYPVDRYLTNEETLKEVNLLELRFRAQSEILRDKKQKIESELNAAERRTQEAMNQFVVPWKGEEFKYPSDRYLTNEETIEELDILELQFKAQSRIMREKEQRIESEERSKREAMGSSIRQSDRQFAGLHKLVKEFKKYVTKKRRERRSAISEEIS